jgi:RNA polymerase sigma-70 factor, ECF subfamily
VATLSLCDLQKSSISDGELGAVAGVLALTNRFAPEIEPEAVRGVTPIPQGRSEPKSAPGDDAGALVGAAVAGDRDAVEGVLRWIRPLVVRYCRARIGGQDKLFTSVDDVAQEVCLAVLTALPGYRDQGRPFLAFVYGIAAHKVADARRMAARNRAEPVPEVPDVLEVTDGPEAQVMQGELAEQVATLLGMLPDKQREILLLRVVVGLSAETTAAAMGTSPGAVRVAQHRALNRLRKVLTSKNRSHDGARPRVRSVAVRSEITGRLERLQVPQVMQSSYIG